MGNISMRRATERVARGKTWAGCRLALFLVLAPALQAVAKPAAVPRIDGEYVIHDFHFGSGESLPELRIHYLTYGEPHRDARGHVDNAVLLLHATSGRAATFTRERFSGVLFGPGQPLDAHRYYLIMPDAIGHGGSSKPSDGLRAHFPHYDYGDMVEAQHALVTAGLGVDHLRLVLGTSMGCMHAFLWGERHASEIDALMPIACLPVAIGGRNRVWRALAMQAIREDPAWAGGDYRDEPRAGLRAAAGLLLIATGSAPEMQRDLPTKDAADEFLEKYLGAQLEALDANDLLYALDASRNYDPAAALEQVTVPTTWVNFADDFVNPPDLGIAERESKRLRNGRFVLIPASDQTHGHGTIAWPAVWKAPLEELLQRSSPTR